MNIQITREELEQILEFQHQMQVTRDAQVLDFNRNLLIDYLALLPDFRRPGGELIDPTNPEATMADLLELRDHLILSNRQTEYFPDETFSTWKYPAVAAVATPAETPSQFGTRLAAALLVKCPTALSFQSRVPINSENFTSLFLSDSAGKNIAKSPSLSVATLVEFAIFQREFVDYASKGGTRGLLECIAEDVKVNIKFYAAHKFEHLSNLLSIEVDNIPEKAFLELCLLRFSTSSESDKTDIKKHLKSIKMSSEKSHLFNYAQFQKFVSAFLYGISIFRKFLPECNDKFFSKLFSDGVSLPIQKFARDHSEQVGPNFSLDQFLKALCEQAETLRVAEPTIEWTHGNALKMGAAGASVNPGNKPSNGGGYKGKPVASAATTPAPTGQFKKGIPLRPG